LEGNNFIPKELTIKETDVVIFNNFDAVAHGIKIGDIAIIPPIPKDMSGSYKFNKKGEYEISSLTIPTITGKIIVE
jgi:plastocyanin